MNKQGFHVSVKPVTKGNGGSVIAKSAYNSGSKLEDKKTNKIHDYTAKTTAKNIELIDKHGVKTTKEIEKNVAYSALIVPKIADKIEVEREGFWNEIELIEKSAKAQLGVEIDVMFPRGLSADQRIELVKEYSQELADRYNILVDVNIHRPHTHIQKKDGQILEITKDNHHAHILLSSREIIQNPDDSYSLSKRKNWGLWSTGERLRKGLNGRGDELKYQRSLWAEMANKRLSDDLKITEKSYREQGINQLPKMKLGKSLYRDLLKGKKSVINEYNETIDDLNKYIKQNDIEIDYNDQGRIDLEINTQVITSDKKDYIVGYKKRKPYASIDLNKISFKSPTKELDNASVLDNFMNLAANIEDKKKAQRSGLLSTIKSIEEVLSKQAEQKIILKNTYEKSHDRFKRLGQEWGADIKLVTSRIPSIKTIDEIEAIKQVVELLDQFREDETKQTTQSVDELKKHLDHIDKQTQENLKIIKEIAPVHNNLLKVDKELREIQKPFDAMLNKAEKALEKINHSVIEKEIYEDIWESVFDKLVDISVTNNIDTFNKYKQLADYDVDALKKLEHEHKQLKLVKAHEINDKTQQKLDDLVLSITSYKDQTDQDLKTLKQQITTSNKSYQRLEPLYSQRQKLLDKQEAVIEQDDDLHNEITTTKTTQLNADKLNDWQQRTNLLHARLIKEHEQSELKKQAEQQHQAELKRKADQQRQAEQQHQAELKRKADQQKMEQEKARQITAFNERVKSFNDRVVNDIKDIDFKAIDAPNALIESAEKLAITAMMLDGFNHVDNLTSIQQNMSDTLTKKFEVAAKNDTESLINQLDKLPDNKQKIEVIEQLNAKFNEVLEHQSGNKTITALQPQLEQLQKTAQQSFDRANSYSSPRPF